jgi:hypothetical protein
MPPEREKGEPLSKFIGRFMKSKRDQKKWPKQSQRLAVGYSEAKEDARRAKA